MIYQGFSSRVERLSDTCVRGALEPAAARRHLTEATVLTLVKDRLAVDLPAPLSYLPPSPEWPHGAQVLPWLDGEPADASIDPESVAGFVRDLHGLDIGTARAELAPFPRWCAAQRDLERAGLAALSGRLDQSLYRDIDQMMTALGGRIESCPAPRLIHGDLWYGNLLMRDRRLVGVLDWEFVAVGDPMVDYAALWYLGDDFVTHLLDRLGTSVADLPDTIGYYRLLRELYGLVWSVDRHDDRELAESTDKIATLAPSLLT